MCGKSPHYRVRRVSAVVGEWIYGIIRKHTLLLKFNLQTKLPFMVYQ